MIGAFVPWSDRANSPGWVIEENGCHTWVGWRENGYAKVTIDRKTCQVYRVRYEREIGPIPEGMELDHYVCDGGPVGCCNPHHCRPVSRRENVLRGNSPAAWQRARTHCPRGHVYQGANVRVGADGKRRCRQCGRERRQEEMKDPKQREAYNARMRKYRPRWAAARRQKFGRVYPEDMPCRRCGVGDRDPSGACRPCRRVYERERYAKRNSGASR